MEVIQSVGYEVVFGHQGYAVLGQMLNDGKYSKAFVLVDEHTSELCLPHFLAQLPTEVPLEVIEIEAGERHKNLSTVEGVIDSMLALGGDRKSCVITVGGGVVSDLGGFVASIYMRGIDCFVIPTTLLAMVDASVGGKTGVDLGVVKNCIGSFSMPKLVLVDVTYLETLAGREFRSGYAEMIKHGLIRDAKYYQFLKDISAIDLGEIETLVYHSVTIKNDVVLNDPKESGERKILNFGHTVGHAIESFYLEAEEEQRLLHGEAIAIGMVVEAYFSMMLGLLAEEQFHDIKNGIEAIYGTRTISRKDWDGIIALMKFDKKNSEGEVKCVLLKGIGAACWDNSISNYLICNGLSLFE